MDQTITTEALSEEHALALGSIVDSAVRSAYIQAHPELQRPEVVQRLSEAVVRRLRVDTREAMSLADAAIEIAQLIGDRESMGFGQRGKANAMYSIGEYRAAVQHHDEALAIFDSCGSHVEAARTRSASIQPLILLGEYDRAVSAAARARETFLQEKLPLRVARLEINIGNIFHRQDRFEEALTYYESAYNGLIEQQDADGLGIVVSNMAICLISLNDFPRALAKYNQARAICEQNGMPLLVAQADYNVAYLYFLRGEHSEAIKRLIAARKTAEIGGDHYHHALCYLDLAEVYLELKLSTEAGETAHQGFLEFEKLGMGYEAAKTTAFEAMALGQQGKSVQAIELFIKARERFAAEKNLVWPWLLDLYQALLLCNEKRYFEARRLCLGTVEFFDQSLAVGKSVIAHLLLARIAIEISDLDLAWKETQIAVGRLEGWQNPELIHHANMLVGWVLDLRGDSTGAYDAYQEARKAFESLRHGLHSEELKIPFMEDRMGVYEALASLCLRVKDSQSAAPEIFGYFEAAKLRAMGEMVLLSDRAAPVDESGQSELVRRIRGLREELNWYYHRIDQEQLRPEEHSRGRIETLHKQAQTFEAELLQSLEELPSEQSEGGSFGGTPGGTAGGAAPVALEKLQAALPADATLIEYFYSGERILAAVVTRRSIEIVPLTLVPRVTSALHALQTQLGKVRVGRQQKESQPAPSIRAIQGPLQSLYDELLAPLESLFEGNRLILVPNGPLHYLPFQALRCGDSDLIDRFTVSYAPSATIFAACQERAPYPSGHSLVMGIPHEQTSEIPAEVRAVADLLPGSDLVQGDLATANVLREKGIDCGNVHIASRGSYRQDNPMLSGILLGDGDLNVSDICRLKLRANLLTLSGCAPGMNVGSTGDELIGLQRGLFHAGASTLLLSLWDVHDGTTADLMRYFYEALQQAGEPAKALQAAMRKLRESHPHPYFWAPFFLSGKL